jgi:hypothetical protein
MLRQWVILGENYKEKISSFERGSSIGYTGRVQKIPNFRYKTKLFILKHLKHCPVQSSPLYWRYTVPNLSSTAGMLV